MLGQTLGWRGGHSFLVPGAVYKHKASQQVLRNLGGHTYAQPFWPCREVAPDCWEEDDSSKPIWLPLLSWVDFDAIPTKATSPLSSFARGAGFLHKICLECTGAARCPLVHAALLGFRGCLKEDLTKLATDLGIPLKGYFVFLFFCLTNARTYYVLILSCLRLSVGQLMQELISSICPALSPEAIAEVLEAAAPTLPSPTIKVAGEDLEAMLGEDANIFAEAQGPNAKEVANYQKELQKVVQKLRQGAATPAAALQPLGHWQGSKEQKWDPEAWLLNKIFVSTFFL
jgi:hypothetical protein